MGPDSQSSIEHLWREYSQAFVDFDDLSLARWLSQTLGQLRGKAWRFSHPIVGAYRLASQVANDRQVWSNHLVKQPSGYWPAPCCRAPLVPLMTREIIEAGLICEHCGETAVAFEDLPVECHSHLKPWANQYQQQHAVAHWDDPQKTGVQDYEQELENAARAAEELLEQLGRDILPELLEFYPTVLWEDQDDCLDTRPDSSYSDVARGVKCLSIQGGRRFEPGGPRTVLQDRVVPTLKRNHTNGLVMTIKIAAPLILLTGFGLACQQKTASSGTTAADFFMEQRQQMIHRQLTAKGRDIKDKRVLDAMEKVPRHRFVSLPYRTVAYGDHPLPIGHGQTISQPYIVAFMTEKLAPGPADRVLEIGTGSGYQAAILSQLAKEVYTIEIVEPLAEKARATLHALNYTNVFVRTGDGYEGWPEKAPFDGIIVTCAPDHIPEPLQEQLKDGGRMIIPVGPANNQYLYLLKKRQGHIEREAVLPVRFVPMTGPNGLEP